MLASHLTSQEQLTLLMAPEARKSDVSQDEPSTKKGLRDVERTTATVGLCLWGGIVKGFKVVFASDGFLNRTTRLLISHYIYIYIISYPLHSGHSSNMTLSSTCWPSCAVNSRDKASGTV